jgi:hypothetical protein
VIKLLIVAATVLGTLSVVDVRPAAAQPNCEWVENEDGDFDYICEQTDPGEDGDDGSGDSDEDSSSGPPCDLSLIEQFIGATRQFCQGQNACWVNDPPAKYPTQDTWPEPPSPDAGDYIYMSCVDPDGNIVFDDYTWENMPQTPPIEDLVREAYGELEAPSFTLAFSPPGESVIYIDTWWWAEGASSAEITGSAALGVVAVAEPDHMEVDPGDGSSTLTCDFVVDESDECAHTYDRASGDGGYPARARLVYDVHFEQDGEPIDVAGAPDTFESEWQETAVPVTEVQSNVVR